MKMKKILFSVFMILFLGMMLSAEYYDGVFIIAGSEAVTFNDYSKNYLKLRDGLLRMGQPLPANAKMIIFKKMISEKIINKVAEEKKLFVSDSEVDEAINNIKKMNRLTDAALKQALEQEGRTLNELKEDYRQQIVTEKIMSLELQPRIKYPEDLELETYYNNHKKDMYEPEKISVSHILIRDNPNATLEARSKLKGKAQTVLSLALKGDNFSKLAEKYSEDEASAKIGGDIGDVGRGEWLPEIDDVIFKLAKGNIASTLLQSRWGWHIVKVTGKKPKRLVPFSDMKARIANYLIKEKMQSEFDKWIKEQMQSIYIEVIFPDNEKYVFDFDKWQKKNMKTTLSEDEFTKKINALKI